MLRIIRLYAYILRTRKHGQKKFLTWHMGPLTPKFTFLIILIFFIFRSDISATMTDQETRPGASCRACTKQEKKIVPIFLDKIFTQPQEVQDFSQNFVTILLLIRQQLLTYQTIDLDELSILHVKFWVYQQLEVSYG